MKITDEMVEAANTAYAAATMDLPSRDCERCEGHGVIVTGIGSDAGGDSCPVCGGVGAIVDFPDGWDPMRSALEAVASTLPDQTGNPALLQYRYVNRDGHGTDWDDKDLSRRSDTTVVEEVRALYVGAMPNAEPVAWRFRFTHFENDEWEVIDRKPDFIPRTKPYAEVQPLYLHPAPAGESEVRVKSLEWEEIDGTSMWAKQTWAAIPELWVCYRISLRTDGAKTLRLEWLGNNVQALGTFEGWDSWDSAKAAAQADYTARIRSAIEAAP